AEEKATSRARVWNSLHAASLCFGAKKQGVNVNFSLKAVCQRGQSPLLQPGSTKNNLDIQ
ncbi:TPA: hypothetical protein ACXRUV_004598, partial [Klebsiella quasipneumoniae subsp. similipneumoniae]